jgi:hypothetical protein
MQPTTKKDAASIRGGLFKYHKFAAMKKSLILSITIFCFCSCEYKPQQKYPDTTYTPVGNIDPDEGQINGEVYRSEEIGWTIEIPVGWSITDRNELDRRDEKGKEVIEENIGVELEVEGLKNLLCFQKDKFNIFSSTSQPFEVTYPGEYHESAQFVKSFIYNTFKAEGIKTDTCSSVIFFQSKQFYVFHSIMFDKNGTDIVIEQTMFRQLINGFDFGVNITYNNDTDRDILLNALKTSRFE